MILLQRFFQICLFKAGPADLPTSHWFLKSVCLIYFAVGVLVSRVDHNWPLSLAGSLADTILLLVVCWLLLLYRGFTGRFTQTATAMAGTGSIVGIVGLPLFWLFRQVEGQGQLTSLVLLLVLVLIIWSLFITAHIFRSALEIKPGTAALITVFYTIISLIVVGLALSGVA
ncbi:hypothetical protein [Methylophaga sp.]|uniref:hypothetical protein n=1 Tax=Methylophaga sp. TaxID=2024840 RepID=UPI003F6A425D